MEDIQIDELKKRIDQGEKLHIIDVREEYEFDEFNIGALLIPLGELPDRLDEIDAWKNEEVIVGEFPISMVTAIVSPSALPRPRTTALLIPDRDGEKMAILIISNLVEPNA